MARNEELVMVTPSKPRIVAIEEHYWDKEVAASFGEVDAFRRQSDTVDRLYEYGEARIQEMDEAGIQIQVLSHGAPSTQRGDAETSVKLAQGANDRLREIVRAHPDRFAAFAALPGTPMGTDQWRMLKAGSTASEGVPGFAALGIQPRPLELVIDHYMVRYRKHGRFAEKMDSAG